MISRMNSAIRVLWLALLSAILLSLPCSCWAEESAEEEDPAAAHLLGNWGGLQPWLSEHGLTVELITTNDLASNVSGGLEHKTMVLGNTDLTFSLDTEKAKLWSGGTFFVYFIGDYGRDPSAFVGDSQASNNIEAFDTVTLLEAWYNHDFLDGRLSLLFGLHDYASEFDTLEYAGTLINSSFGLEPEITQVGPSIFQATSLAARLRFRPTKEIYVQTAVYDGVPGDPNHPHGTHIRFDSGDGIFWGTEVGATSDEERYYKLALGTWYHTKDFEDYNGNLRDSNFGAYAIGERKLWNEEDSAQGLGGFLQFGRAPANRNSVDLYFGAGLTYTGLIPSRDADVFSLGLAYAHNSKNYRQDNDLETAETAFEVTYRSQITDYFALQPDFQIIKHPSGDRTLDDAVVLTLRSEVAF